jgi:hypothetical protein
MSGSTPTNPVDCTIDFDASHLSGKTAVVTGGTQSSLGIGIARMAAASNIYLNRSLTSHKEAVDLARPTFVPWSMLGE